MPLVSHSQQLLDKHGQHAKDISAGVGIIEREKGRHLGGYALNIDFVIVKMLDHGGVTLV